MNVKSSTAFFAVVLFLAGLPRPVLAQVDNPALSQGIGWAILKTVAALLFILGLFFVLIYLMKRYNPRMFGSLKGYGDSTSGIEVVAVRPMGGKRFLYLVGVGKRRFLLGVSDQSIQTLGTWEDESFPIESPEGQTSSHG